MADYNALKNADQDGAFVASQLGHVLGEYSAAETDYKEFEKFGSGIASPWFLASHNNGDLPAEGRVMSETPQLRSAS